MKNSLPWLPKRGNRSGSIDLVNVMTVGDENSRRECLGRRKSLPLPEVLDDPTKAPWIDPRIAQRHQNPDRDEISERVQPRLRFGACYNRGHQNPALVPIVERRDRHPGHFRSNRRGIAS